MQYVNIVFEDSNEAVMHTAPVPDGDAAYLRQAAKHLKPLSDEEYMTGPAGILHTMAKYSHVLDGDNLYWCVEWEPGLVIVRMRHGQNMEMEWVALRSPVPNFAGREPLPEDGDPDDYDGDDNPQYNLIFTPWDAQFDQQDREWKSFTPADDDVQSRFQNALARVNALSDLMQSRYTDDSEKWLERCTDNLEKWAGEGVRLKIAS